MNFPLRKSVSIGILLLVATAFFYDRFVIKRQRDRIQAELIELANDMSHTYSAEQIDKLIGRMGVVASESKYQKTVKYSWRGFSWNSYDIFVQFRKIRDATIMVAASSVEQSPFTPMIERWTAEQQAAR